jgi:hypothetical protein
MEGSPGDTTASSEKKKDETKSTKKSETAFGLGKSTFEITNKKDKAEKIAEAPWWEKLIPKEGEGKTAAETPVGVAERERPESKETETADAESAEEVTDPTVENLSLEEKGEVVKDYAQEKVAELEAGRSEGEEPAAAAEREANIQFLHQLEQAPDSIQVEIAETESDDIGESAEEKPEEVEADEAVPEIEPAEVEDGPAEFEHGQEIILNEAEQSVETVEKPGAEDEPDQQTPTATPVAPPVRSAGFGAAGGGPNFNAVPTGASANPNAAPASTRYEDDREQRRNEATYFFAGGSIGYLIGRRRGRIKTEKRMRAVTKKLEQQIDTVRKEVARQEVVIREQARQNYNLTHPGSAERVANVPRGAETTAARTVTTPERAETVTELTQSDVAANRRRAAERLGVTPAVAAATAERIQHMDHREVLEVAEKLVIDGTSLRTIFESKQITEPGLRRITREFLRGGDVKAALQHEIQVKEMQYERDPQMRDRLAASYAGVDAAQPLSSQDAITQLMPPGFEQPKSPTHQTAQQAQAKAEADAAKDRNHQFLMNAWVALVVVLVVTVFILIVT